MSQFKDALFPRIKVKTHLHFLKPGANHLTPLGSTLKRGEASEQYGNMDITVIHKGFSFSTDVPTCSHGTLFELKRMRDFVSP